MVSTSGDCESFHASASSRPPDPSDLVARPIFPIRPPIRSCRPSDPSEYAARPIFLHVRSAHPSDPPTRPILPPGEPMGYSTTSLGHPSTLMCHLSTLMGPPITLPGHPSTHRPPFMLAYSGSDLLSLCLDLFQSGLDLHAFRHRSLRNLAAN